MYNVGYVVAFVAAKLYQQSIPLTGNDNLTVSFDRHRPTRVCVYFTVEFVSPGDGVEAKGASCL